MNVTYGIQIADHDDTYITVAETALDGMAKAAHPCAFLVDIFPICKCANLGMPPLIVLFLVKYVPNWMPFSGFKEKAREWRTAVLQMRNAPFEAALGAMVKLCHLI